MASDEPQVSSPRLVAGDLLDGSVVSIAAGAAFTGFLTGVCVCVLM